MDNLHIGGDNPLIELPAKITKTNHARVVAVEKACVLALNDYLILERKAKDAEELFVSATTGRGFHYETGKHLVREIGVRGGVAVGAHDFRRAFVCRMQEAGMSDSLIMQLTGHRTERMIRVYGRPAAQQNAILAYRRAVG